MSATKRTAQNFFLLFFLFFPASAFALTCVDGIPQDELFSTASVCSGNLNLSNIFSGLNCRFQMILSAVMSRVYCGIQFSIGHLLIIGITISIIIYAISFSFGISKLNLKEISTRILKIAMIWAFAMNASWGVDLVFTFLIGAIDTSIFWVMKIYFGNVANQDVVILSTMQLLDALIVGQVTAPFSDYGYKLLGFFAAISLPAAPLFFMFVTFLGKALWLLLRTLITYLLGIGAIAFLISLGPIFVSFALFKTTFSFFETWLQYLISFVMQVILIFASFALFLVVLSFFGNFFAQLGSVIYPYQVGAVKCLDDPPPPVGQDCNNLAKDDEGNFIFEEGFQIGPNMMAFETYGICPYEIRFGNTGPYPVCVNTDPENIIPPSKIIEEGFKQNEESIIFAIVMQLTIHLMIVYAFDTLMINIPNLARQLSGPKYAPMLGGGQGLGAVNLLGGHTLSASKQGFLKGYTDAENEGEGPINRLGRGASYAWRAMEDNFGASGIQSGTAMLERFRSDAQQMFNQNRNAKE